MIKHDQRFKYPRSLRLIRSEDYGVLVRERNEKTFGLAWGAFSLSAKWREPSGQDLRFGVTVGKRNCHRSVDRALVKRLLKEEARHRAPSIREKISRLEKGLDVSLRLRSVYDRVSGADIGVAAVKKTLRKDVAGLFDRLESFIDKKIKVERCSEGCARD